MPQELNRVRTRWAAIGAAIAVSLGAGGIGITHAALTGGERTSFVPITPCRLADTRPGDDNVGDRAAPIGAGQSITLEVHGARGECNLADGATGVSLNVTALNATQPSYLTLYPTGGGLPTASHLNPAPGQPPTPNAVEVDVNSLGQFNVFNGFGTVDVIIDVVGYYEDHNHDDRYYTEAEVDGALAAKANASSTYTRAEIDAQRSGEYTCAAVDFLPSNDGETYFTGTGVRYSNSTTQLSCGAHPPVGARITGLRARFPTPPPPSTASARSCTTRQHRTPSSRSSRRRRQQVRPAFRSSTPGPEPPSR